VKKKILTDTTLSCTVCGETDATLWRVGTDHLLGGIERFRAVRCVRCGTRRLDPRPDAETMARYYAPDTYARAEEEGSEVGKRLDAYAARLADHVTTSTHPTHSTLDIGCGDGRFMEALQTRGWHIIGTETDPVAADLARKRTGATVYESPLPPAYTGPFDLISLLHVLEHVPDPRETLSSIRHLLAPGGKLLLVLPNADSFEADFFGGSWYHLDLPRHLWAFTPYSLVRLVEECGFVVDDLDYTPFLFAPQSMIRVANTMNGGLRGRTNGVPGIVSAKGGSWQTRLFQNLLHLSDRIGKEFPGEIMELTATAPAEGTD